ncbi:hypothetical protein K435DRAFT_850568 [Dendrothele bispora CBS 962.96]|uniref:Mitochondrial import inner membrane translocase subunit TIM50 n=1 Tax=Dendrothele bispora (strain CBS 962.96) TaxID=1314807 RepID=A0A4S8MNZ7_DENBC|nr:hypothetical protein K435DRAFT_850568 [Dendrothele bispora CBS 962.96]
MASALTPEYISISQKPSTSSSHAPRKLLVLDLNGSLLLRTKRVRKQADDGSRHTSNLRSVHLRPYMQSFRDYIFHPRVKEWLDAMVWSSAQPHSVNDMVDKCFGEKKADFVAVWARDTFGLDPTQYHQKSQTTKDLAQIWTAFPSHSANTTCLLDDSPRKARRQPWNHLCIHEYDTKLRSRDIGIWKSLSLTLSDSKNARKKQKKKEKIREKKAAAERDTTNVSSIDILDSETISPLPSLHERDINLDSSYANYDKTLLAIIGILEEIKSQTNVLGWIRAGGLGRIKPLSSRPLPLPSLASECGMVNRDENENEVKDNDEIEEDGRSKLLEAHDTWFEQPQVVEAWADKGRHALGELGIEIIHGVQG